MLTHLVQWLPLLLVAVAIRHPVIVIVIIKRRKK
jgi:hypothetical protein